MFWTCVEERYWIYWTKDVRGGVTRTKKKKKTSEEMYRCPERKQSVLVMFGRGRGINVKKPKTKQTPSI